MNVCFVSVGSVGLVIGFVGGFLPKPSPIYGGLVLLIVSSVVRCVLLLF